MRNGFTFNGKHTSEFSRVTVQAKDRPVFPSVKEQVYNADEMDGEYDFSDVSGREYFNTRTFQFEFGIAADNLSDLQKKLSKLSAWFKGRGTLIFDDIPLVKWNVRIVDSVSYMPENGGKKAVLTVSYKAMPFSELVFDVIEGPCLNDEIELDSEIPLDTEEYLTFSGTGTYTNIPNVGDVHIKPVITVTGAAGTVSITCNGVSITVSASGNFVIDCEKEQVYSGSTSLMTKTTGEFFELAPGTDNTIIIDGNATVQINYTPKFLYSTNLDEIDWGDE